MKPITYPLLIVLLSGFICSCDTNKQLVLTGQLTSHSNCKSNVKSTFQTTGTPDTLSCVEYSFDEVTNKLTLKHINAAFNCCPESIYCKIELLDDTIAVQEFEKKSGCKCDCIYDLDIEISGVEKKKYQLKILEPYVQEQSELKFEVDLMKDSVGSFCVTRKQYPWGM